METGGVGFGNDEVGDGGWEVSCCDEVIDGQGDAGLVIKGRVIIERTVGGGVGELASGFSDLEGEVWEEGEDLVGLGAEARGSDVVGIGDGSGFVSASAAVGGVGIDCAVSGGSDIVGGVRGSSQGDRVVNGTGKVKDEVMDRSYGHMGLVCSNRRESSPTVGVMSGSVYPYSNIEPKHVGSVPRINEKNMVLNMGLNSNMSQTGKVAFVLQKFA
eukprot:g47584.t1